MENKYQRLIQHIKDEPLSSSSSLAAALVRIKGWTAHFNTQCLRCCKKRLNGWAGSGALWTGSWTMNILWDHLGVSQTRGPPKSPNSSPKTDHGWGWFGEHSFIRFLVNKTLTKLTAKIITIPVINYDIVDNGTAQRVTVLLLLIII